MHEGWGLKCQEFSTWEPSKQPFSHLLKTQMSVSSNHATHKSQAVHPASVWGMAQLLPFP